MNFQTEDTLQQAATFNILYRYVSDTNSNYTYELLNRHFNNITPVLDQEDVFAKYRLKDYDIVITNIDKITPLSIQTCVRILEINPEQEILLFYNEIESQYLSKLIDLGIKYFVQKPYKDEEFITKLSKVIYNIQSRKNEKENLMKMMKLNSELDKSIESFDKYVIASRTDLDGTITYASKAYQEVSGYSEEELVGQSHNIVRHPDVPSSLFQELWETIQNKKIWSGEIKNLRKDGTSYWVEATISPYYDHENNHIGYSAIRYNISDKKKVEELSKQLEGLNRDLENQVVARISEIYALNEEIKESQKEVLTTMGTINESRCLETGSHVKRVAEYSKILALNYGLDEEEAEMLKEVSPMHDIGKVAIPDSILKKNDCLTQGERDIMDTHTTLGYNMLKNSNKPLLKMAATVAHEHHEKYDGSGYPRGIQGEDISIYGRITALADVFDALGSSRVYKPAWEDEKIFTMFREESGKHFDPKLIDIFFENLDQFLRVRDTFK